MLPLLLPLALGGGGGGIAPSRLDLRRAGSWKLADEGLMGKEPALLRLEALRCGGRGGGRGLAAAGREGSSDDDEPVAPLPVSVNGYDVPWLT